MFAMGCNVNFKGFQPTTKDIENHANASANGLLERRDIEEEELLNNIVEENAMMFDKDIGESSKDEQ